METRVYPESTAPSVASRQPFSKVVSGCHFFIEWPDVIPAHQARATPVTQLDLFPTLTSAAGASLPQNLELDGKNLLSPEKSPREMFWRNGKYRSYRQGR
ncbi:MAG: hypothetical protein CL936_09340 [Deltaproteobacteria bacterium]|nr:hypothetical protein [Deltaproteobacteria bacterium]